jgi:hypothetical protein
MYRASAFAFMLLAPLVGISQQRNIVYPGVPDFVRNEWTIVLGPSSLGGIKPATGNFITGNESAAFSEKQDARVVGDYTWLDIVRTIQYNFVQADGGYNTLFKLESDDGDVILEPGSPFWRISIRYSESGPYATYVGVQPHQLAEQKELSGYAESIERQRTFLERRYSDYSLGLD